MSPIIFLILTSLRAEPAERGSLYLSYRSPRRSTSARDDVLKTWFDPADRDTITRILTTQGIIRDYEVKRRTKSGQVLTMSFSADIIKISGESCLLSVSQVITERKKMEEQLERHVNFTSALLNAVPTPVFYKDRDGRYQGCNRAFSEVMGVTSDEIQGKSVHDLWPSEHAEVYHRTDLELMANPEHQVYEFMVKDKRGEIRPVIYAKDVFRDERGAVAGLVGAFLDISELKKDRGRTAQGHRYHQQKPGCGIPLAERPWLAGGICL